MRTLFMVVLSMLLMVKFVQAAKSEVPCPAGMHTVPMLSSGPENSLKAAGHYRLMLTRLLRPGGKIPVDPTRYNRIRDTFLCLPERAAAESVSLLKQEYRSVMRLVGKSHLAVSATALENRVVSQALPMPVWAADGSGVFRSVYGVDGCQDAFSRGGYQACVAFEQIAATGKPVSFRHSEKFSVDGMVAVLVVMFSASLLVRDSLSRKPEMGMATGVMVHSRERVKLAGESVAPLAFHAPGNIRVMVKSAGAP